MKFRIYDELPKLNLSVIVEAGGHIGQDTRQLCTLFPDAQVHTCEPLDVLMAGLKKLKKKFKNLHLYETALFDYTGTTDFYLDLNSNGAAGASSILPSSEHFKNYLEGEEKITVPCITLSQFCKDNQIPYIDLLWLDIEMTEYRVLKASKDVLKNIKYIYTEISYSSFRVGQCSYEELDNLLTENGFKQIFIEPQGHPELLWQANALYAHE